MKKSSLELIFFSAKKTRRTRRVAFILFYHFPVHWPCSETCLRDRSFNLKGGGYGFLFRSENFLRATQEVEYFYFFPEFNIRLYDKNSESYIFFFLHQIRIGNQNIFLEKNHNPPLQVKWSFPYLLFYKWIDIFTMYIFGGITECYTSVKNIQRLIK